jgi:hypothetical protein
VALILPITLPGAASPTSLAGNASAVAQQTRDQAYFLALFDRVLPESYVAGLKERGGYELLQTFAALGERLSRAAAVFQAGQYIGSAVGDAEAIAFISLTRATATVAGTLSPGSVFTTSKGERDFVTTTPVSFAIGDLGPHVVGVTAAFAGYEWNVRGRRLGANILFNPSFTTPATVVPAASSVQGVRLTVEAPSGWLLYNNSALTEITTISQVATGGVDGGPFERVAFPSNTTTKGLFLTSPNRAVAVPFRTQVLSWFAQAGGSALSQFVIPVWNTPPVAIDVLSCPPLSGRWQRYAFRLFWGASAEQFIDLTISAQPTALLVGGITGNPNFHPAILATPGNIDFDQVMLSDGPTLVPFQESPPLAGEIDTVKTVLDSPPFTLTDLVVAQTSDARGGVAGTLDQLGADRGVPRNTNEPDESYRLRVRTPAPTVTPAAIQAAVSAALSPFGFAVAQFTETFDLAYQTVWNAPNVTPPVGSRYNPNLFVYNDPRPAFPFQNRWLTVVEMRGTFIVVVPVLTPASLNGDVFKLIQRIKAAGVAGILEQQGQ